MKNHTFTKIALTLTILVLTAACGDDEGDPPTGDASTDASAATAVDAGVPNSDSAASSADQMLEQMTIAKLKTCGAYEPSADPGTYTIEDEFDRCAGRCILAASCAEYKAAACDEDDNGLARCALRCPDPPADGYRCEDGSVIAHAALCDLYEDCSRGEDERNCGEFDCSNGEVVPAKSARCDTIEDCEDGSDERGCALSCF